MNRSSFSLSRIFILTSLLLPLLLHPAAAEEFQAKSATLGPPAELPPTLEALPPPDPAAELDRRMGELRDHHLAGPLEELPADVLAAAPPPTAPATDVAAANISLLKNRALTDAETSNVTSQVGEPSVAARGPEVLITGNWYASFSSDDGGSFSYLNPATTFPEPPGQPFCCDQVAIYDPAHDLMVWYLQYVQDGSGNTGRLAVAAGADIAAQRWRYYDFTPRNVGNWTNEWFDYPDLAVGADFLYVTTNVFSTPPYRFRRALILRVPLDELAAYQSLNYDYYDTNQAFSFRPTHGATDVMYFGSHVTTNTLRVFTWPESSPTISSDDVVVEVWSNATRVAPGPDGRDWLGRADPRITAAWRTGDTIGFGWTAAQDDNFPFPHVRVAVLDRTSKAVVAQPHLWSGSFAYAYPAAAPNSAGVVGISVAYGGGSQLHPSHAVGALDAASVSWNLVATANGTHGPSRNVWGDYLAARPHGKDPTSWAATGFTQQGGPAAGDIQVRYVHFRTSDGGPQVRVTLVNEEPDRVLRDGDTLRVRATVTRDGTPLAGETVSFSSSDPSLATVQGSATTDAGGEATAQVTGRTSTTRRTVTITAEAQGATANAPVRVPDLSLVGFLVLIAALALLAALSRRARSS